MRDPAIDGFSVAKRDSGETSFPRAGETDPANFCEIINADYRDNPPKSYGNNDDTLGASSREL